jgi:FixJ family two-component response regulator
VECGKVYVVDDDPNLRRYLCELLALEGYSVQGFAGPIEFERAYSPAPPECLLLDMVFPSDDGLGLLRRLRLGGHCLPVVLLTGHGDVDRAVECMKLGALDFLQKPVERVLLLQVVERALQRRSPTDETGRLRSRALLERLTPRERDVLDLVASGLSSKEIALRLGLSKKTIDVHRAHMLRKLEARSVADLVRIYVSA